MMRYLAIFLGRQCLLSASFLLVNLAVAEEQETGPAPRFTAKMIRSGQEMKYTSQGETTVFVIPSQFDIERATIKRLEPQWPKTVIVRLHLKGLEHFQAGTDKLAVEWAVTNSTNQPRASLIEGEQVTELAPESPYFGKILAVPAKKLAPANQDYFEIQLPAKLFEGNPAEIKLDWVDFFRG